MQSPKSLETFGIVEKSAQKNGMESYSFTANISPLDTKC